MVFHIKKYCQGARGAGGDTIYVAHEEDGTGSRQGTMLLAKVLGVIEGVISDEHGRLA